MTAGRREAAWAAAHDPSTDAATLAAIVTEFPEFGDAVARHPRCYPELRAWVAALPAAVRADPAPARRPGRVVIVAAIAAGVLVLGGGAAWAALAILTPTGAAPVAGGGSSAASPEPAPASERTLAGPPVYIGDELSWFLLSDEQVSRFFGKAEVTSRRSTLSTVGETEGALADPEACNRIVWGDVYAQAVGIRTVSWFDGHGEGGMAAQQFASGELASAYFHDYVDNLDLCASFRFTQNGTVLAEHTLKVAARGDDAVVLEDTVRTASSGATEVHGIAVGLEGNVVTAVQTGLPDGTFSDPQGLLTALTDLQQSARVRLADEIGYR